MLLDDIFLYCSLAGGVVLLLQLATLLLGMDDGGLGDVADAGGFDTADADASADSTGFWLIEMISLRTLAAAATFFGLVGKTCLAAGQPPAVALGLGAAAGYAAMYAVYWTFRQIFRLETSGNTDIRGAVGAPARVYVPIDPVSGVPGKVQLKLQGRTVEYQATTDHTERLATGEQVIVTDVVSSDTVKVAPDEAE